MAKVLVVEDERAIAEVLELNLRHVGHQVRLAYDANEAQAAVREELPDIVVLDWMLPGEPGTVLARRWRADARTRELPILMLTARSQESDLVQSLDSGADDYMSKPFSPAALMARIRALLRRKAPETLDEALQIGALNLDPATMRVSANGAPVRLGPTEFRLLRYLMTYPERVHSRGQLLDRVWGDHVFIEERTVDVHVKRLRDSLHQHGCAQLIETVRGAGYRLARHAKPDAVARAVIDA